MSKLLITLGKKFSIYMELDDVKFKKILEHFASTLVSIALLSQFWGKV